MASCTLHPDPAVAWKELEKSENRSSRAWFIVINALMRCAHTAAFPQVYSNIESSCGPISAGLDTIQTAQFGLDVLANSLYCISSALPAHLSYNGEFLNFSGGSIQVDSSKLSIHIMTQLSRFMLHHLRVFNSTYKQLGVANSSASEHFKVTAAHSNILDSIDRAAWDVYLAAAAEIVNIVRNSSPKHVRNVNPFLSSSIWLGAAAQIISCKIGPHLINRRVAESNFDLLQMNLHAYVSFWGVSSSLQHKLKVLAARLEAVNVQGATSAGTGPEQTPAAQNTASSTHQMQQLVRTNGNYPLSSATGTQYAAADQRAFFTPLNLPNGSTADIWSDPQAIIFGDALDADQNASDIWGYGLDELLTYGGF